MRESCWDARIQWTKPQGRPKQQNELDLVRLALKQLNECNLTAILSDKDSGSVLMQVCGVSALHEELMEGKGYNEITLHDVSFESASKSYWKWTRSVSIHQETAELK